MFVPQKMFHTTIIFMNAETCKLHSEQFIRKVSTPLDERGVDVELQDMQLVDVKEVVRV